MADNYPSWAQEAAEEAAKTPAAREAARRVNYTPRISPTIARVTKIEAQARAEQAAREAADFTRAAAGGGIVMPNSYPFGAGGGVIPGGSIPGMFGTGLVSATEAIGDFSEALGGKRTSKVTRKQAIKALVAEVENSKNPRETAGELLSTITNQLMNAVSETETDEE